MEIEIWENLKVQAQIRISDHISKNFPTASTAILFQYVDRKRVAYTYMSDWNVMWFNLCHLTMKHVNTQIPADGKMPEKKWCKQRARPKDILPGLPQSTTLLRSLQLCSVPWPWCWAHHTPGLCGWPPCGRRLQWRAASTLHPFPPKFLLVRALSHPAGQPEVAAAPGISQALCWAGKWGQGWPKAHGKGAGAIIDWGSALGLSPWPPVGQGCPHRL